MYDLPVPERAIQTFETIHGLQVTIHDLGGSLGPGISRDRFQHRHLMCRCVKAAGGDRQCNLFEILRLRANLHAHPEGRYHICHAGLVEWMTPVFRGLELEWILFAGVRMPARDLDPIHREPLTSWQRLPWDDGAPMPALVRQAEAFLILEHLQQLAARLHIWADQRIKLPAQPFQKQAPDDVRLTQRRTLIRRYIEAHHSEPVRLRDLASQLKVTEHRATHLIRECCGQTFREMLTEARLKSASELLRFSSLPILEIALTSGFTEISHFNRLFRQRVGCAPGQFRRNPFQAASADSADGEATPKSLPPPGSTVASVTTASAIRTQVRHRLGLA